MSGLTDWRTDGPTAREEQDAARCVQSVDAPCVTSASWALHQHILSPIHCQHVSELIQSVMEDTLWQTSSRNLQRFSTDHVPVETLKVPRGSFWTTHRFSDCNKGTSCFHTECAQCVSRCSHQLTSVLCLNLDIISKTGSHVTSRWSYDLGYFCLHRFRFMFDVFSVHGSCTGRFIVRWNLHPALMGDISSLCLHTVRNDFQHDIHVLHVCDRPSAQRCLTIQLFV